MKRLTATLFATAALAATPAAASVAETWDADGDGILTAEEFRAGARDAGVFDQWDEDGDGRLTADEFGAALFVRFDEDDDGDLTVPEWEDGIDRWYGERTADFDFSDWDLDEDGVLDRGEFVQAFENRGLYTDFSEAAGRDPEQRREMEDETFLEALGGWFDPNGDNDLSDDAGGFF